MKRNHALAVQAFGFGLKCDRPGCGYKSENFELTIKTIPGLVGTPCPQCGANLLTKEDARMLVFIHRMAAITNFVLFPVMVIQQVLHVLGIKRRPKDDVLRIKSNGTGKMEMEEPHDR
jgi:hypothetical protein